MTRHWSWKTVNSNHDQEDLSYPCSTAHPKDPLYARPQVTSRSLLKYYYHALPTVAPETPSPEAFFIRAIATALYIRHSIFRQTLPQDAYTLPCKQSEPKLSHPPRDDIVFIQAKAWQLHQTYPWVQMTRAKAQYLGLMFAGYDSETCKCLVVD